MVGSARIAGQSINVSGDYGNCGLPLDYERLTPEARDKLVEVPQDVADIFWNTCDGWNGAGSEARTMVKWAKKEKELRKK